MKFLFHFVLITRAVIRDLSRDPISFFWTQRERGSGASPVDLLSDLIYRQHVREKKYLAWIYAMDVSSAGYIDCRGNRNAYAAALFLGLVIDLQRCDEEFSNWTVEKLIVLGLSAREKRGARLVLLAWKMSNAVSETRGNLLTDQRHNATEIPLEESASRCPP